MGIVHIERRTVARLAKRRPETVHYDQKLTGFGLRVAKNGSVSYFIEYRPGAGGRRVQKRRLVIGKESPAFRADMARDKAEKLLGAVALGDDPAVERKALREAATVDEVVEHYLTQKIEPTRKASTAVIFRGHFQNHIKPEIGGRLVVALTKGDVTRCSGRLEVIAKLRPTASWRCSTLRSSTVALMGWCPMSW